MKIEKILQIKLQDDEIIPNMTNHILLKYKTENELKFEKWAMREFGMTNEEQTEHTLPGLLSSVLEISNVIDVILLPVSLFSAGAKFVGKEALKEGGEELAEAAGKQLLKMEGKEALQEAVEKGTKELAQVTTEKTMKEAAVMATEKSVKELAEEARENLAKELKKLVGEITGKITKNVVEKTTRKVKNIEKAVSGDMVFQSKPYDYFNYIKNRLDVDVDGYFDIVAHGDINKIQVRINGKEMKVDHRFIGNILRHSRDYSGQPIRLLSCNTGFSATGFAQNLANYLNVKVIAPTKYIWAYPNGEHMVAGGKIVDNKLVMVWSDKGFMKTFYPGGGKH